MIDPRSGATSGDRTSRSQGEQLCRVLSGWLVEVRVVPVVRRLHEPELIPAPLAQPEVLNSTSPGPDARPASSRHLIHGGRPTRGTLLSGTGGETLWRAHFPFGRAKEFGPMPESAKGQPHDGDSSHSDEGRAFCRDRPVMGDEALCGLAAPRAATYAVEIVVRNFVGR